MFARASEIVIDCFTVSMNLHYLDSTEKLIVVFDTNHYGKVYLETLSILYPSIVTIMRISRFSRASVGEISASSSSDSDSDDNPGHKLREIRVEDDETKKKGVNK